MTIVFAKQWTGACTRSLRHVVTIRTRTKLLSMPTTKTRKPAGPPCGPCLVSIVSFREGLQHLFVAYWVYWRLRKIAGAQFSSIGQGSWCPAWRNLYKVCRRGNQQYGSRQSQSGGQDLNRTPERCLRFRARFFLPNFRPYPLSKSLARLADWHPGLAEQVSSEPRIVQCCATIGAMS
jgi:hypothetical protein